MRITQSQIMADGLTNTQSSERAIAVLQQQLSSGTMVSAASDNPAVAGRLVRIESELSANTTAQNNATLAKADLGSQDAALQSLSSVLSQAQELAVQGANGSLTPTDLAALKASADGLLNQALSLANTQVDGRSMFGGTATQVTPYSLTTAGGTTTVAYSGSTNARTVPIGDTTIVAGSPGPGPFAGTSSAPGALDAIAALSNALGGGGGSSAVQATISGLQSALSQATVANAAVGASMSDLTNVTAGLQTQATQIGQVKSAISDTDVAAAATQLSKQQATYQAGLQVLATVMSTSILTYLPPGSL